MPFSFDDKDPKSLEQSHTHFLLLDDGKYTREGDQKPAANDSQEIVRSDFVTYACKQADCQFTTVPWRMTSIKSTCRFWSDYCRRWWEQ